MFRAFFKSFYYNQAYVLDVSYDIVVLSRLHGYNPQDADAEGWRCLARPRREPLHTRLDRWTREERQRTGRVPYGELGAAAAWDRRWMAAAVDGGG